MAAQPPEPQDWLTTDEVEWELQMTTPPQVRPPEPIPVEVLHEGEWWPGQCLAWRGDRVSVRFSRGVGLTHLMWVPADAVRRA